MTQKTHLVLVGPLLELSPTVQLLHFAVLEGMTSAPVGTGKTASNFLNDAGS